MKVDEIEETVFEIQTMHAILHSFQVRYLGNVDKGKDDNLETTLKLVLQEVKTEGVKEEHMMILDGCLGICYGFCDSCTKKFEELNAAKEEKWMKYVLKNFNGEWGDMVEVEEQFRKDMENARKVLDGIAERMGEGV